MNDPAFAGNGVKNKRYLQKYGKIGTIALQCV